jgi:hypothetical protein
MKAKKETRIFCVLLIFSLLFGLCSCYKTEEEYDPSLRIEIEAGEIVYGEEFLENANARFANIVVYLLESYLGSILSEARKEALSTAFSSEAAPLFMKAGIYESEVSAILSEAEKCVMLSAAEGFSPAILFSLYECSLYTVGSLRSGRLAYFAAERFLSDRIATAEKRYEQYGMSWYLADAERLKETAAAIREMGEGGFSSAVSILFFTFSLANQAGAEENKESAFALREEQLLSLLARQGAFFEAQGIEEADFSAIGALISEMIPDRPVSLSSALSYALKNENYFSEAARVLPSLVCLYADVAAALSSSGTDINGAAIARALLENEESFRASLEKIERYAMTASERERAALLSYVSEEMLSAFSSAYPAMDADALIEKIGRLAAEGGSADALFADFISYLNFVMPYIAFVAFGAWE